MKKKRKKLERKLDEHNKYLESLGVNLKKKKKKDETFVFQSCEDRTGVGTGDKIPVSEKGNKKKEIHYTGKRKLLGIGLLHKSNLVPVWDEEDAKDITKMRRG
tara:strand:- start:4 stop:312 length:309 start_codon:yes stop_codon:yes gene_type:complete